MALAAASLAGALTGCGRWARLGEEISSARNRVQVAQAEQRTLEAEAARLENAAAALPVMKLGEHAMRDMEAETSRLRHALKEAAAALEEIQHEMAQTRTQLMIYQGRYLEP